MAANKNSAADKHKIKSAAVRILKTITVKKWIDDDLAKFCARDWLEYEEKKGIIISLRCKVCRDFRREIESLRDFNPAFINGSKNLCLSNARDHATSSCHTKAYNYHLRAIGKADQIPQQHDPKQKTIFEGFSNLEATIKEQLKKKFEVAYLVAKEEMPFTKYESILNMETHHGVDIGTSYVNNKQCGIFIDCHGEYLQDNLKKELRSAKYLSVLTDGTTDNSTQEQEVVYVLYFNSKNYESVDFDEIDVKLVFLYLKSVRKADASGIQSAIEASFGNIGIDRESLYERLVGFGADGASVNSGRKSGLAAKLKEKAPWLIFIWCVAHRLELAIKDSLDNSYFKSVDHMLMRLYYIYFKSSKKKMSELKSLADILKDCYDFANSAYKPKKACGTRWISFKSQALNLFVDKFGLYIQHLERLAAQGNNAEIAGYLRMWKDPLMILYSAFFIDILKPASILSKVFQGEGVDIVTAIDAIGRSERKLEALKDKQLENFPTVKNVLDKIAKPETGPYSYQGVNFSSDSYHQALEKIRSKKPVIINSILKETKARLQVDDQQSVMYKTSQILNSQGWIAKATAPRVQDSSEDQSSSDSDDAGEQNINEEALNQDVLFLFNHFRALLEKSGLSCSEQEFISEWEDLFYYAIKYLNPNFISHKKTWKLLFQSAYAKTKWRNVLLLIEILYTLPVSNAKLERMFSKLKRTKTDFRCSLGEQRLTHLLRIMEEGPPPTSFDVSPVVDLWNSKKVRRPHQKKRKPYRKRAKTSNMLGISASACSSTSSSESEQSDSESESHTGLENWWENTFLSDSNESDFDGF